MSSESLSSTEGVDDQTTIGLISNMEAYGDHQTFRRYRLLYGVAFALGVTLVLLMFLWLMIYQKGFGWQNVDVQFNWHPMLMVLGLLFIYSQSMLVYRTGRDSRKMTLKLWHAGLHLLVFILVVIALKAVFDYHNYSEKPKPNLYTFHSWIGLITVILFSAQYVAGFVTFLFPGLPKEIRATILPAHTNFGAAIFLMAVASASLGLSEKAIWAVKNYDQTPPEAILVNVMGVILICFGAVVLYLVNDTAYKRVSRPDDEIVLTGFVKPNWE